VAKGAVKKAAKAVAKNIVSPLGPHLSINEQATAETAGSRIDYKTIEGFFFEAVTSNITGAKQGSPDSAFDFPFPTQTQRDRMAALFSGENLKSSIAIEAKRSQTYEAVSKSGKNSMFSKLMTVARGANVVRPVQLGMRFFNKGGAVGTDTVPAMLTPGEYVINRKSAQGIGYGNLKRMNEGGAIPAGVKGFAEGGIVTAGREFYGKNKKQKAISKKQQIRNLAVANGISEQQAKKLLEAHNLKGRPGKLKAARLLKEFKKENDLKRAAGKKVASPAPETAVKKKPVSPPSTTGQVQPLTLQQKGAAELKKREILAGVKRIETGRAAAKQNVAAATNAVKPIIDVKEANKDNRRAQTERIDTRKVARIHLKPKSSFNLGGGDWKLGKPGPNARDRFAADTMRNAEPATAPPTAPLKAPAPPPLH